MEFKEAPPSVPFSTGVCLQRWGAGPGGGAPHLALGRPRGGAGAFSTQSGFASKASRLSCPQGAFLEDACHGERSFDSSAFFNLCVLALSCGRGEKGRPGSPASHPTSLLVPLLPPAGSASPPPSL